MLSPEPAAGVILGGDTGRALQGGGEGALPASVRCAELGGFGICPLPCSSPQQAGERGRRQNSSFCASGHTGLSQEIAYCVLWQLRAPSLPPLCPCPWDALSPARCRQRQALGLSESCIWEALARVGTSSSLLSWGSQDSPHPGKAHQQSGDPPGVGMKSLACPAAPQSLAVLWLFAQRW